MKNKKGTLLLVNAILIGLFSIGKITAQTVSKAQEAYNKEHADDAKYLKGFDEKAVIAELKKKGIRPADYKEVITSRKNQYIAKQKGKKEITRIYPKPYDRSLRTSTVCANAGFEDSTFTGWTGGTGDCSNYPTPTNWTIGLNQGANNLGPNTSTQQDILTCTTCYDPTAGGTAIPYVAPGGGNVSVRLGNSQTGSGTEYLEYNIYVTAQNTSFTYQYAVVLEDPGHTATQQPRFDIAVTDSAGNAVSGPCGAYDVNATDANTDPTFFPFYVTSPFGGTTLDGYYKPWTAVTIALNTYIGSHMLIRFTTQDCTLGGHYGYAYIDASCSQLQTIVAFCPTDTIVRVTAPLGFNSYQWYTVSPYALIPGATSSTLTILHPVVGTQYSVNMTSVAGCGSSLTATLAISNMSLAQNSTNVSCNGLTNGAANVSQSGGNGPFNFTWQNAAGTIIRQYSDTTGVDTLTNLAAGTYYVQAQTPGGCFAADTIYITQPALLPVTHIGSPFCPSDAQVTLSAPAGSNYQWYAGSTPTGTILGTGSTYTATNPVLGQFYTVNYLPPTGCASALADSLYYSSIAVQPQATQPASCYGLNDGQATVTVSGMNPPFSYSWTNGVGSPIVTTTGTLQAGAGTYTVTVSTPGGCINTATLIITQPPPTDTTYHKLPICPHDASALISATQGNTSYQWYGPNHIIMPGDTNSTLTVQNPNITQQYVVSSILPGATCRTWEADSFYLYKLNQPPYSTVPPSCYGYGDGSASITQPTSNPTGASGPFTYSWINASNSSTVGSGTSVNNIFAGTYYVTATTPGGCAIMDTVHVTQPANNFDSLKLTTKYCPGDNPIILHAPHGYSGYTWYGNPTASGPVLSTYDSLIVVLPVVGTQYTVTMPNPAGGSACDIVINYTLDYSLPPPPPNFITNTNVFSPNGDGKNDYFLLNQDSYGYIKEFHLEVYNRWGKKVYETNDFNSQWDGKDKSNAVDEGVYYWMATYTQACLVNAPTLSAKGFVQVVK